MLLYEKSEDKNLAQNIPQHKNFIVQEVLIDMKIFFDGEQIGVIFFCC